MKEINRRVYEYNKKVIAEDDHITLYGLVKGRQSYETVFKTTKALPLMVLSWMPICTKTNTT